MRISTGLTYKWETDVQSASSVTKIFQPGRSASSTWFRNTNKGKIGFLYFSRIFTWLLIWLWVYCNSFIMKIKWYDKICDIWKDMWHLYLKRYVTFVFEKICDIFIWKDMWHLFNLIEFHCESFIMKICWNKKEFNVTVSLWKFVVIKSKAKIKN